MIPSMLIKEPGCQTRARPEKFAKVWKMCMHHNSYMATSEEKQVDAHLKMEWQICFSENHPGVNPVVMNYKIRHNKKRPARYIHLGIVSRGQTSFLLLFMVAEKWKNTVWMCEAMCEGGHGGKKACSVCELARALVSRWILLPSHLGICKNKVTNLM